MPTITSAANATVKAARKLGRRRNRALSGRFLVEGPKVLAAARGHLETVFVAETADAVAREEAELAADAGADLLAVSDEVLATLSATETSRGVVGVARLDEPSLGEALDGATFALLCCEVADPGNVGTIVRTADAACADAVVLTEGSVDARNPKAVRASAGSLFHLPVVAGATAAEALGSARQRGLRAVAADASGTSPHTETDLGSPTLLVLGAEAQGLRPEVLAACDASARVDMCAGQRPGYGGRAESLNLAATAAVMAFEAARQRAPAGSGRAS